MLKLTAKILIKEYKLLSNIFVDLCKYDVEQFFDPCLDVSKEPRRNKSDSRCHK